MARTQLGPERLETLWINTGTHCNVTYSRCYCESSSRKGLRVSEKTGRRLSGETGTALRDGFVDLFAALDSALDARDPSRLAVFPEMDATADAAEITEYCWSLPGKQSDDVMCASSRMIVMHKDTLRPAVLSCTLLPCDEALELGCMLADANQRMSLHHPHRARSCVLSGTSCSQ